MTGQLTNMGIGFVFVGNAILVWGLWSHSWSDVAIGLLFVALPFAFQQYNRWHYSRKTNKVEVDD